ncbi:MAG: ThuA domain-containing protein [Bryobacteraceae bacterium]
MVTHRLSRRGFVGLAASATAATGTSSLRLLIVTGGHEFDPGFWDIFNSWPEWKTERRAHQPATTCTAYDNPIEPEFEAVLLYDMPKSITEPQQRNFLALFERGTGVVVLHHALAGLQQWSTFEEIIGLRMREKGEGGLPPFTYKHDVSFELQRVDIKHPVLDGVPSFEIFDETYGRMYYHPDIQPLMVTNHPTSISIVVWTRTYRKSRVVMIQPGHGPQIFANPHFRRLIGNSVSWAARRDQEERTC